MGNLEVPPVPDLQPVLAGLGEAYLDLDSASSGSCNHGEGSRVRSLQTDSVVLSGIDMCDSVWGFFYRDLAPVCCGAWKFVVMLLHIPD